MEAFPGTFCHCGFKVGLPLIECSINFPDGISTFSLLSELIEFLNRQFQNHSSTLSFIKSDFLKSPFSHVKTRRVLSLRAEIKFDAPIVGVHPRLWPDRPPPAPEPQASDRPPPCFQLIQVSTMIDR